MGSRQKLGWRAGGRRGPGWKEGGNALRLSLRWRTCCLGYLSQRLLVRWFFEVLQARQKVFLWREKAGKWPVFEHGRRGGRQWQGGCPAAIGGLERPGGLVGGPIWQTGDPATGYPAASWER